ncbi:hypothetical protein BD413DRAFT_642302 [Trametes elegans]|nr:hypothetical protein BD413DRAFT_642302 [Trametes elegans]
MKFSAIVALSMALAASAHPGFVRRASFTEQNGKDAIALNQKFAGLNENSPCQTGENACVQDKFAQCVGGKFVSQACGAGTICAALPLVNSAGTSITCTTAADRDARIAATGATGASGSDNNKGGDKGGNNAAGGNAAASSASAAPAVSATMSLASNTAAAGGNNDDPQKSLTLVQSVIATGFQNDGQDQPAAGQVASATSSNNFINFCATVPNLPITNGQQIKDGSCNPTPMGVLPSTKNMPSSKFQFPTNNGKVTANKDFTVKMAISNLETGHFTNAQKNYFAAPQVVNGEGKIEGHSHIVIEKIDSLDSTKVTDPTKFAFFLGLNSVAKDGVLTGNVAGGLPMGTYRLGSINAAANHQPVLVPVAQHGMLDDIV